MPNKKNGAVRPSEKKEGGGEVLHGDSTKTRNEVTIAIKSCFRIQQQKTDCASSANKKKLNQTSPESA